MDGEHFDAVVVGSGFGGSVTAFRPASEVADLDRFGADDRRAAGARKWVECEAPGGRLAVERDISNLFVEDGPGRKRMLYRPFFRDGVGHPLTLTGSKVVRERSGGHVWRDTTTPYTRVVRGHVDEDDGSGAETVASGISRLRPADSPRQLAIFRARGESLAGQIAAIARFEALFLGALWQVYGRRFAGLRNVQSYLRRRHGKPR